MLHVMQPRLNTAYLNLLTWRSKNFSVLGLSLLLPYIPHRFYQSANRLNCVDSSEGETRYCGRYSYNLK